MYVESVHRALVSFCFTPNRLHSTKSASGLGAANEKVDQPTYKMEAEDDDDPDQFLDAVEAFVGDSVDEHPNPKDASSDA